MYKHVNIFNVYTVCVCIYIYIIYIQYPYVNKIFYLDAINHDSLI